MRGYDAWLTHDPRDRSYAPCECGHAEDLHNTERRDDNDDVIYICDVTWCECVEYQEACDDDCY